MWAKCFFVSYVNARVAWAHWLKCVLCGFWVTKAVVRRCSVKKVFLEISQNSQENTCARDSFFNKVPDLRPAFIKKESLPQVFSCEFCEISKNTYFNRTPPLAVSEEVHIFTSVDVSKTFRMQKTCDWNINCKKRHIH